MIHLFLQIYLVIQQLRGYLQFGIFDFNPVWLRRCPSFFNPWCAVKLTKWRNVIRDFTHGAFTCNFICQPVIRWPSIILSWTVICLNWQMVYMIFFLQSQAFSEHLGFLQHRDPKLRESIHVGLYYFIKGFNPVWEKTRRTCCTGTSHYADSSGEQNEILKEIW